jgi:hypothetical protein
MAESTIALTMNVASAILRITDEGGVHRHFVSVNGTGRRFEGKKPKCYLCKEGDPIDLLFGTVTANATSPAPLPPPRRRRS